MTATDVMTDSSPKTASNTTGTTTSPSKQSPKTSPTTKQTPTNSPSSRRSPNRGSPSGSRQVNLNKKKQSSFSSSKKDSRSRPRPRNINSTSAAVDDEMIFQMDVGEVDSPLSLDPVSTSPTLSPQDLLEVPENTKNSPDKRQSRWNRRSVTFPNVVASPGNSEESDIDDGNTYTSMAVSVPIPIELQRTDKFDKEKKPLWDPPESLDEEITSTSLAPDRLKLPDLPDIREIPKSATPRLKK